ncbi:hypothetical protein CISG_07374 [Coccidioides immitis RMSCC 3703]|uniref:mRNA export factor GLE1 n=1 Tax=Coccidioides immitis RMSCC 3703 TaxID=454286 RepID=A0A0J8TY11_COCIT|nr:hypothetical protein CISG_07374 [Coccidioides immitis RMSCC 3703]
MKSDLNEKRTVLDGWLKRKGRKSRGDDRPKKLNAFGKLRKKRRRKPVRNVRNTNEIVTILKKASALQEPPSTFANLSPSTTSRCERREQAQLVAEAGVTPKCAGPLGVLTAQVFSMDAFVYKGCSMIDILLAKYHVVCPVLWGFYGSESTQTGKTALGWWRDEPDGPFVSRQVHEERMIGLGAGFAAISLRDFSKTSRQNPLPNTHFWKALSIIVNVPPEEIQDTHLTVLGAMLKFSAQRVVGFWGDLGLLALRHAIVTFPSSLSKKSSARSSVEILRDLYAREHCILI